MTATPAAAVGEDGGGPVSNYSSVDIEVTGTYEGRWTSVLWRNGDLLGAPDVVAVVELAADVDDLDLAMPRDAATAIMLALDHVEHLEVHPTQTV